MENAGWQQMKIKRSMSSSSAIISAASSEAVALNSNSCASSVCLPRNAMLRRIRSIALLRPTLTSHARGLDGGSAAGQRSSAVANASCSASSARSKSPTRRISVASARPASSRNIFSISIGVMRPAIIDRRSGACAARTRNLEIPGSALTRRPGMTASLSTIDPDRPDLDRTRLGAGNARGNGDRGVEILGLDQIVAAELLPRFRERTIRRQSLAVANAHGGRGRCRLQCIARLEIAALDDGLGEGTVFLHHFLARCRVDFAVLGLVLIDHQQILHLANSCLTGAIRRHPVERANRKTTSSG